MADTCLKSREEILQEIFNKIEQWQQSYEVRFDKTVQRFPQPLMGQPDGDRTLFVKIHLKEYLISWEVLDQVFSSFGNLEIIEVFDDEAQFHSRIRFQTHDSALKAFGSLNGRCIYDYCCRLELFLGSQSNDISSDRPNDVVTQSSIEDATKVEEFIELEPTTFQGVSSEKFMNQECQRMNQLNVCHLGVALSEEAMEIRPSISGSMSSNLQKIDDAHKVFDKLTAKKIGVSFEPKTGICEVDDVPVDSMGIRSGKFNSQAVDCLGKENHEVDISDMKELELKSIEGITEPHFDLLIDDTPRDNLNLILKWDSLTQLEYAQMSLSNRVFDPGDTNTRYYSSYGNIFVPLMNKIGVFALNCTCCADSFNRTIANGESILMPFDRGKLVFVLDSAEGETNTKSDCCYDYILVPFDSCYDYSIFAGSNYSCFVWCDHIPSSSIVDGAKKRLQWDPGGKLVLMCVRRNFSYNLHYMEL